MAMQEDQPNSQKDGDHQATRSLVVRSEQTLLIQAAETPFLQQVGFSPMLGQRLARLNETITSRAAGLEKVAIEMVPGETPLITTQLSHGTGYRLFLESTGEKASLSIRAQGEFMPPLALTFADVKTFVGSVFPGEEARFHQYLKSDTQRYKHLDDVDEDLHELTEEEINKLVHPNKEDILETHGDVDVIVTGPKGEAILVFNIVDQWDYRAVEPDIRRRPIFHLVDFRYAGRPGDVEAMLDGANVLFDKPDHYPFRYDDPWLQDPEQGASE